MLILNFTEINQCLMKRANSIRQMIAPRQLLAVLLFIESLIVAIAIAKALSRELSPAHYFGENRLATDASCIQLIIASVLAGITFWTIKRAELKFKHAGFWLLVSLGLLFLAVDDAYEIHERLDLWLHVQLQIEQTDFTDLADDLIVGGYLLIFLGYVARQWRSLQVFRRSFIWFKIGLALALVMVILDLVGNNDYFISLVIEKPSRIEAIEQWLGAVEDSFKLFAEGMFIVGIYHCWQIARFPSSFPTAIAPKQSKPS